MEEGTYDLAAHLTCERCSLASRRVVPGYGSRSAKIALIGEAPGREEDEQGRPFVGQAGKVLSACLEEVGLDREDIYVTNVISCRPPDNDLRKAPDALLTCPTLWLRSDLNDIQPSVIVTLGLTAARQFFGTVGRVHDVVGRVRCDGGRIIVGSYHPSYYLRSGKEGWIKESIVRSLKIAKEASKWDSMKNES